MVGRGEEEEPACIIRLIVSRLWLETVGRALQLIPRTLPSLTGVSGQNLREVAP